MTTTLPPGWTAATLGDVAEEVRNGISTKPDATSGTPILRISAVRPMSLNSSDVRCLEPAAEWNLYRLAADDLLFTRYNGNPALVGVCARVHESDIDGRPELVYPDKLIRVRVNTTAAHPGFIERAAHTHTARAFVRGKTKTSAGQVGISGADLKALPLSLPPLSEQRRIVAKLDAIFEQTRATKARLERLPALLEKLKRSILAAAFRGDLTKDWRAATPNVEPASVLFDVIRIDRRVRRDDPQRSRGKAPAMTARVPQDDLPTSEAVHLPSTWKHVALGNLFSIHVGATPSRSEPSYWGGEISWVSSGEVAFCRISSTGETITEAGLQNSSTRLHPPGTILLGMIGEGKTRGQAAILDIEACTNQNVAAIRVSETSILPEYVYFALAMQYEATRRIGSGNNQQALNKSRVEAMVIPLAPLSEQVEIVRLLKYAIDATSRLRSSVERQIDAVANVDQSLLAKAFRGELVPQDPTDQPADVLVERIRSARAAAPAAPRRSRSAGANQSTATAAEATNGHASLHRDELLDLVIAAFHQGECRLGATTIAQATGLDATAVRRALATLVDSGQVRVHGRARGTTYEWSA